MSFSQSSRIWWDTTQPGAGTSALQDATPDAGLPASSDSDTGTEGVSKGIMVRCARSGFTVPESETVIDAITGNRVWKRFADKSDPAQDDTRSPHITTTRSGDTDR